VCFFYGTYVELENFDYMSIVVQLRKYLYSVFSLLRPRAFCALSWSHSNIFPCPTLLRANSSSNGLMKGFSWLTKYLSPLGLKGFWAKVWKNSWLDHHSMFMLVTWDGLIFIFHEPMGTSSQCYGRQSLWGRLLCFLWLCRFPGHLKRNYEIMPQK
jgi:hypothetical protein